MNNKFYEKMAQFQPAQPTVIKPSAHARIGTDDVKARLMVASIFGIGALIVSLSLAMAVNWQLWPFAFAVGIVVFLSWMYWEMLDAKDLQRPDLPQQPELSQTTAPQTVTIRGEMQQGGKTTMVEFHADPKSVAKFARRIRLGSGFSEKTAARSDITQTQWVEMRDQFITRGWAQWRNDANRKQGIELLEPGAAWLQKAGE